MTDPQATQPNPQDDAPRPGFWKRTVWWLLKRAFVVYVGLCVLVFFLQRKLMYVPSRAESITWRDARLPRGVVADITFPTADGLTLNAWHVLPQGETASIGEDFAKKLADGRPVVLFFHGNGGDRRGRVPFAELMTSAGAHVLLTDYRGYGDNPGSPSEKGLHADALGVWNYAVKTCGVKPSRIVLFGESLGGGPAVKLARVQSEAGTPPGGLYLRSAFSSMTAAASHHYPWLPVRSLLLDRFASDEHIQHVTCPISIMHGTADRIVPFASGKKLFDAAPDKSSNGVPKHFLPLDGVGHNGVLAQAGGELKKDLVRFLKVLTSKSRQTE